MASADLAFALEFADLRIETKFWDALTDGGEEGPCGWLIKDRYGVSWQIVPKVLYELIGDPDRE
jgi:predicted 3-demethylubiquinone-9 3-methyltransferase (glyoxalase superfamily)